MTVKEQALEKMLKEMSDSHSATEDIVHNYLCTQDDEELNAGILKDGRTIRRAIQYCASKARQLAENNAAMVADDQVFSWIREYFLAEKVEVPDVVATVATAPGPQKEKAQKAVVKSASAKKAKAKHDDTADAQMSIFDFL